MSDDHTDEGLFWIDANGGDDELSPVLVGVTDRESDALARVHLPLYVQRRHKVADAIGDSTGSASAGSTRRRPRSSTRG